MLTKVRSFLVLVGLVLMGVWKVFAAGKSSGKSEIKAKAEEAKNDYQQAGYEAARTGIENEQKINEKTIDLNKRDHFE